MKKVINQCGYHFKIWPFSSDIVYHAIFQMLYLPHSLVDEDRSTKAVWVEGEAVVDEGGGEPQVVADHSLHAQVPAPTNREAFHEELYFKEDTDAQVPAASTKKHFMKNFMLK